MNVNLDSCDSAVSCHSSNLIRQQPLGCKNVSALSQDCSFAQLDNEIIKSNFQNEIANSVSMAQSHAASNYSSSNDIESKDDNLFLSIRQSIPDHKQSSRFVLPFVSYKPITKKSCDDDEQLSLLQRPNCSSTPRLTIPTRLSKQDPCYNHRWRNSENQDIGEPDLFYSEIHALLNSTEIQNTSQESENVFLQDNILAAEDPIKTNSKIFVQVHPEKIIPYLLPFPSYASQTQKTEHLAKSLNLHDLDNKAVPFESISSRSLRDITASQNNSLNLTPTNITNKPNTYMVKALQTSIIGDPKMSVSLNTYSGTGIEPTSFKCINSKSFNRSMTGSFSELNKDKVFSELTSFEKNRYLKEQRINNLLSVYGITENSFPIKQVELRIGMHITIKPTIISKNNLGSFSGIDKQQSDGSFHINKGQILNYISFKKDADNNFTHQKDYTAQTNIVATKVHPKKQRAKSKLEELYNKYKEKFKNDDKFSIEKQIVGKCDTTSFQNQTTTALHEGHDRISEFIQRLMDEQKLLPKRNLSRSQSLQSLIHQSHKNSQEFLKNKNMKKSFLTQSNSMLSQTNQNNTSNQIMTRSYDNLPLINHSIQSSSKQLHYSNNFGHTNKNFDLELKHQLLKLNKNDIFVKLPFQSTSFPDRNQEQKCFENRVQFSPNRNSMQTRNDSSLKLSSTNFPLQKSNMRACQSSNSLFPLPLPTVALPLLNSKRRTLSLNLENNGNETKETYRTSLSDKSFDSWHSDLVSQQRNLYLYNILENEDSVKYISKVPNSDSKNQLIYELQDNVQDENKLVESNVPKTLNLFDASSKGANNRNVVRHQSASPLSTRTKYSADDRKSRLCHQSHTTSNHDLNFNNLNNSNKMDTQIDTVYEHFKHDQEQIDHKRKENFERHHELLKNKQIKAIESESKYNKHIDDIRRTKSAQSGIKTTDKHQQRDSKSTSGKAEIHDNVKKSNIPKSTILYRARKMGTINKECEQMQIKDEIRSELFNAPENINNYIETNQINTQTTSINIEQNVDPEIKESTKAVTNLCEKEEKFSRNKTMFLSETDEKLKKVKDRKTLIDKKTIDSKLQKIEKTNKMCEKSALLKKVPIKYFAQPKQTLATKSKLNLKVKSGEISFNTGIENGFHRSASIKDNELQPKNKSTYASSNKNEQQIYIPNAQNKTPSLTDETDTHLTNSKKNYESVKCDSSNVKPLQNKRSIENTSKQLKTTGLQSPINRVSLSSSPLSMQVPKVPMRCSKRSITIPEPFNLSKSSNTTALPIDPNDKEGLRNLLGLDTSEIFKNSKKSRKLSVNTSFSKKLSTSLSGRKGLDISNTDTLNSSLASESSRQSVPNDPEKTFDLNDNQTSKSFPVPQILEESNSSKDRKLDSVSIAETEMSNSNVKPRLMSASPSRSHIPRLSPRRSLSSKSSHFK